MIVCMLVVAVIKWRGGALQIKAGRYGKAWSGGVYVRQALQMG